MIKFSSSFGQKIFIFRVDFCDNFATLRSARFCRQTPDRMAVYRQYSDHRAILAPDQRPRIRPFTPAAAASASTAEPKHGEDTTTGGESITKQSISIIKSIETKRKQ